MAGAASTQKAQASQAKPAAQQQKSRPKDEVEFFQTLPKVSKKFQNVLKQKDEKVGKEQPSKVDDQNLVET